MTRSKKPTPLDLLFTFAIISGLFLAIEIHTGMDVSETGLALTVVKAVSNSFGEPIPWLIPSLSIVLPLANIGVTAVYLKTAIEHKHRGILVSCGGFFGMLAIILGSLSGISPIMYLGFVLFLAGVITSGISRKF